MMHRTVIYFKAWKAEFSLCWRHICDVVLFQIFQELDENSTKRLKVKMKPTTVVDEMFPEGVGTYMDEDVSEKYV